MRERESRRKRESAAKQREGGREKYSEIAEGLIDTERERKSARRQRE